MGRAATGKLKVPGIGTLSTRPYRKWCPHCYYADISSGLPPYDRLLWSIDLVRHCPVHEVSLSAVCPDCGKGRAPHLFGRDISGFCPRCRCWLGRPPDTWRCAFDDQERHSRWVTRSLADLLEAPPPSGVDLLPNIQISIRRLAELHHGGKIAHLARQIRRNKSVIATWLSSRSRPSWDALCDISYAYQLPLDQMFQGVVAEIKLSEPIVLPHVVRPRQGHHRKRPVARDPIVVAAFLASVAKGDYPSIKSVRSAAARLDMNVREIYRIAPDAAREVTAATQARKANERAAKVERRSRDLENAVQIISANFAATHAKVTHRLVLVDAELAKLGYQVRWAENKLVLALVQHSAALALALAGISWPEPMLSGNY